MSGLPVKRQVPDSELPDWAGDLHPVLARVFASRSVHSGAELDYSLGQLPDYQKLKSISQAVDLLESHIRSGSRILVVADFDADGATSCAVALRCLRSMGAADVSYLVPNRFEYGYGLTPEIVGLALQQNPGLCITVDNGISSVAGVARARDAGVDVLVTDHHLPGAELPAANAIVNPNQPGCGFKDKNLAGVGVIFYVMLALRARLRESGWFQQQALIEPNLAQVLDLVALGTVADVVPLSHVNRILVQQGIHRIRSGKACAGIRALLQVAGREAAHLASSDLGFAVGPRLNAAGRLDDMSEGIECLLQEEDVPAMKLARHLDALNLERRQIESDMQAEAEQQADLLVDSLMNSIPFGFCLYEPHWHQGVVGLLASRIKSRFYRPVVAFADDKDGMLKGSARSIEGVHIRDVLDRIATSNAGLLDKFGGHAMAAGMSLRREHLEVFRSCFDDAVREWLDDAEPGAWLVSDGEIPHEDITSELALELRHGSPWGQCFEEPYFDGEFVIQEQRVVGENHLKLTLLTEAGKFLQAIAFRQAGTGPWNNGDRVHLVYRLDMNYFRGQANLQLVVEQIAHPEEVVIEKV